MEKQNSKQLTSIYISLAFLVLSLTLWPQVLSHPPKTWASERWKAMDQAQPFVDRFGPRTRVPKFDRILRARASWYGAPFHGRLTANGETYDMHKLTAAHKTLPFDTQIKVTNLLNNEVVVVRVNDRGPYVHGREVDLSLAAAKQLGMVGRGVVPVKLEIMTGRGPFVYRARRTSKS